MLSLPTSFDTTPLKQYSICIWCRVVGLTDIKLLQLRWRALTDWLHLRQYWAQVQSIKTAQKKDSALCPSDCFLLWTRFQSLSLVLFFIVILFQRHDNRNSGALNNEPWLHSRLFDLSSSKQTGHGHVQRPLGSIKGLGVSDSEKPGLTQMVCSNYYQWLFYYDVSKCHCRTRVWFSTSN